MDIVPTSARLVSCRSLAEPDGQLHGTTCCGAQLSHRRAGCVDGLPAYPAAHEAAAAFDEDCTAPQTKASSRRRSFGYVSDALGMDASVRVRRGPYQVPMPGQLPSPDVRNAGTAQSSVVERLAEFRARRRAQVLNADDPVGARSYVSRTTCWPPKQLTAPIPGNHHAALVRSEVELTARVATASQDAPMATS